jgi:hypothetical protein
MTLPSSISWRKEPLECGRAARVGSHLGAQVGEVLGKVADGVGTRREQGGRLRFAELAALDEPEVLDQHALLLDAAAAGRHRTGRDPADVGMVSAGGHEEQGRRRAGAAIGVRAGEHRRDHCEVGQVGAAGVGRVEKVRVAWTKRSVVALEDGLD